MSREGSAHNASVFLPGSFVPRGGREEYSWEKHLTHLLDPERDRNLHELLRGNGS